jgi:hypothetical protein
MRASKVAELAEALRLAANPTTGPLKPSPHAAKILRDPHADDVIGEMSRVLGKAGIRELRPLDYGMENMVFDAGDRVVKVGAGLPRKVPQNVRGILPYEQSEAVGPYRIQVQRRVDWGNPSRDDVMALERQIGGQGWRWGDASIPNMGFLDGGAVAIDGDFFPVIPSRRPAIRAKPSPVGGVILDGLLRR